MVTAAEAAGVEAPANGIILSICIATLNRAPFLRQTLDSIVSQATDAVEIVIVDGHSTDDTEAVVKDYRTRFPRLRYLRLAEKGGVDQDYCRAMELATGAYCWLFTDDDIMNGGAIDAVLAAIAERPDLILVNGDVRTADLSGVLLPREIEADADRRYPEADWERLFVDTAGYISFIGCVVIRREVWNERRQEPYLGTVFVHVGVIFQQPMPGGAILLAAPRITVRYGNSLWTPRSFEISLFKWPDLVWSLPALSDSARQAVSARRPWDSLTALAIYRARGVFSRDLFERFIRPRIAPGLRRSLARLVASCPGMPLNVALTLYLALFGDRHSQPAIRIVDLQVSRYAVAWLSARVLARRIERQRNGRDDAHDPPLRPNVAGTGARLP